MSIIIKGVEMPKESWECPCHNGETGWCKVTGHSCYDIPKDCPLVEIQTPLRMSDDTISRQDAIDIVEFECGEWTGLSKTITERFKLLPPAQPEQTTAKWIPITKGQRGYSAGDFQCSGCRKPNRCYHLTDYCPNCGAKMENSQ